MRSFNTILIILIILVTIFNIIKVIIRAKYFNTDIANKKCERLKELMEIIHNIKTDNYEVEQLIQTIYADTVFDDDFIERFIAYRDNEDNLRQAENEQKEIKKNFRIARFFDSSMFTTTFFRMATGSNDQNWHPYDRIS